MCEGSNGARPDRPNPFFPSSKRELFKTILEEENLRTTGALHQAQADIRVHVGAGRITLSRSLDPRPCYHRRGAQMTNMSGVIQQLKKERERLEDQLHRVTAAITAFGRVYLHGTGTKAVGGGKKRTISAAARQKISLAQKARWAKQRTAKPKRTISAAGRRRIAAAQRARWAKAKGGGR